MNQSREWVEQADPGGVRRAAGIRRETMAAWLGISRGYLAQLESGRMPVPVKHFSRWRVVTEKLARHLEIPETAPWS